MFQPKMINEPRRGRRKNNYYGEKNGQTKKLIAEKIFCLVRLRKAVRRYSLTLAVAFTLVSFFLHHVIVYHEANGQADREDAVRQG